MRNCPQFVPIFRILLATLFDIHCSFLSTPLCHLKTNHLVVDIFHFLFPVQGRMSSSSSSFFILIRIFILSRLYPHHFSSHSVSCPSFPFFFGGGGSMILSFMSILPVIFLIQTFLFLCFLFSPKPLRIALFFCLSPLFELPVSVYSLNFKSMIQRFPA